MEKSRKKNMSFKGLVKLNKNDQSSCSTSSIHEKQKAPETPLYEEEFPSLSEVGEKSSPARVKSSQSNIDLVSYSGRLRVSSQHGVSKSENIPTEPKRDAGFSLQTSNNTTLGPNSKLEDSLKMSHPNNVPERQMRPSKPLGSISDFSKQKEIAERNDSNSADIQRPMPSSDKTDVCNKQTRLEGDWTVVRNKAPLERNAHKHNDYDGSRNSKITKNLFHKQPSSASNLTHHSRNRKFQIKSNDYGPRNVTARSDNSSFNVNKKQKLNTVQSHNHQVEINKNSEVSRSQRLTHPTTASNEKDNHSHWPDRKQKLSSYKYHYDNEDGHFSHLSSDKAAFKSLSYNKNNGGTLMKHNTHKPEFDIRAKEYNQSNFEQSSRSSETNTNNTLFFSNSWSSKVKEGKSKELRNTLTSNSGTVNSKLCKMSDLPQKEPHARLPNNRNSASSKNNPGEQPSRLHVVLNSVGSKKDRKSKVKRQAAMQSDKIKMITSETHSQILNLRKESNQLQKNITVNINDSEEYPELGAVMTPKYNVENSSKTSRVPIKREISDSDKWGVKENNGSSLKTTEYSKEPIFQLKGSDIITNELSENDDEVICPEKLPIHYNDPIEISIWDMLLANKSKKKELEKTKDLFGTSFSNSNFKKSDSSSGNRQFVNQLDSTKPAIKRGKEREKPKPKKPSQLKKIILIDRKRRKEMIMQKQADNNNQSTVENNTDEPSMDGDSPCFKYDMCAVDEAILEIFRQSNCLVNASTVDDKTSILETNGNFEITQLNSKCEGIKTSEQSICPTFTKVDTVNVKNGVFSVSSNTSTMTSADLTEYDAPVNGENSITDSLCSDLVCDIQSQSKCTDDKLILEKGETFNSLFQDSIDDIRWLFDFHGKCFHRIAKNKCALCVVCKAVLTHRKPKKNIINDHILCNIRYLFQTESDTKKLSTIDCMTDLSDIQYLFEDEDDTLSEEDCHSNRPPAHKDEGIKNIHVLENRKDKMQVSQISAIDSKSGIEVLESKEEDTLSVQHQKFSDKEILEASLVLLHTKKFREYCNHFVSKNLEDAVLALLEDLARFQDRMHQKDPVKARMKRRLLYGMREIKRHMKIKKLKCLIIASDIEDSKTQGGLNDILNDLKSLAKDYQIPCVFSLYRRKLGHVCRKPAPVSAVGVYNYEGSEVNFKKMLEFQNEAKMDYDDVIKALSLKLTSEHIDILYKAKQDSSNICAVITALFKEYFPNPDFKTIKANISNLSEQVPFPSFNDAEILRSFENANIIADSISANKETSFPSQEQNYMAFSDTTSSEETTKMYNILKKYNIVNY